MTSNFSSRSAAKSNDSSSKAGVNDEAQKCVAPHKTKRLRLKYISHQHIAQDGGPDRIISEDVKTDPPLRSRQLFPKYNRDQRAS